MITREQLFEQAQNLAALLLDNPEEGLALQNALHAEAKRLACLTEFKRKVSLERSNLSHDRQWEKAEGEGRQPVMIEDANESNETIRKIGTYVADKRLAFTFGEMPVVIKQSQSAFSQVTVRDRSGEPILDENGAPVTKPARALRAAPMQNAEAQNVAIDACAFFHRTKGGEFEPCLLPPGWPGRMIAAWEEILPPLKGFASYPVWHNDELLVDEGYHEATRLYLRCNDVNIDAFTDLGEAVSFLRNKWLGDFPFASESDAAAALMLSASILMGRTVLMNAVGPPLFLITATSAGTGKSLLANVLIAAVLGEMPGSTGYPDSEEEREKRVGAAILEGHPALLLDNLKSGSFIGRNDVTLTKLVTDVVFSGRVLGMTKTFKGPAGLPVVATGNNVVVDGDMVRRTLEVRLEAPAGENLATRTFSHANLIAWTLENRGRILGALQALLQVKARGRGIGGFPEWAGAVAMPILSAMNVDASEFFQPWEDAAEEDAKGLQTTGIYNLLQAIAALHIENNVQPVEGAWLTSAEIFTQLRDEKALSAAIQDLPEWSRPKDAKALSFFLKRHAGSAADGEAGMLRLQTSKKNLGGRTDRKVRPVFRVMRSTSEPPAMPVRGGMNGRALEAAMQSVAPVKNARGK